jgi:hypothetical protein
MSNIEDIEQCVRRLENAIAALTKTAINTEARCFMLSRQLSSLMPDDAELEHQLDAERLEYRKTAREDVIQEGGLLPEEP